MRKAIYILLALAVLPMAFMPLGVPYEVASSIALLGLAVMLTLIVYVVAPVMLIDKIVRLVRG